MKDYEGNQLKNVASIGFFLWQGNYPEDQFDSYSKSSQKALMA